VSSALESEVPESVVSVESAVPELAVESAVPELAVEAAGPASALESEVLESGCTWETAATHRHETSDNYSRRNR
jgi:hypothetical protein